jgi:hypothetical protein
VVIFYAIRDDLAAPFGTSSAAVYEHPGYDELVFLNGVAGISARRLRTQQVL